LSRLSLSTVWNAHRAPDAASMIKEITGIGFNRIELNFTLTSRDVRDIIDIRDKKGIEVTSVHNFCPMPDGVTRSKASPDLYSLSSLDEKERRLAVGQTIKTIDTAARAGASCVILHLGRVEISDRTRDLEKTLSDKASYERLKKTMKEERARAADRHLQMTFRSVEELVAQARKKDIVLGLENRYYYREIPLPAEMESLLDKFKDRHVGYWHDVGHAQVFENLGLFDHKKDYLDRFAGRMVGMHLHDIKGMDDHRPPLGGDFDFSIVTPFLKKGMVMVIEAHYPATAKQIRHGSDYLETLYGDFL
jgi:sugar phosphate isomerase/epimerase